MSPEAARIRKAAVAGQFYPGSKERLEETVRSMIAGGRARKAIGAMVPHAGYEYSGAIAGEVYAKVATPDLFVILGPNHRGLGPPASIMTEGTWRLPGGDAFVDRTLGGDILRNSRTLAADEAAHSREHSIEVQLPFLMHLKKEVRFVPVSMMTSDAGVCRDIGMAVAAAIRDERRGVLVIASSDMSHYETQEVAEEKDRHALERILALDPAGLLDTVRDRDISMCGAAPAAVMLYACRELGATSASLVRYATSGDVNGDYLQVVGYAGVIVE
ncbi:MAG: AmmeMemoRadiSam system protein B [Thermoleophilia bacterium]|nr:AmmeMemoRadiSam system protein B [Thermoleophilia bacterium]